MKKIFIVLAAASAMTFTGCLKDKGFENHQYGINTPESGPAGVGFPWATSVDPVITSINPSTTATTVQAPTVTLAANTTATQDIHVNLALDMSLVAAYNALPANAGSQLTTFPTGAYNIPTLKVTIPAGKRLGALNITIPTTTGLSFSNTYGLGFRIVSVDEPGYVIAENMKNVVIGINVKNQYDADYEVSGYFFHPTAPRGIEDVKRLATVSAVTLRAPHSDLYTSNYYFDFDVSPTNTLTNYVARGATPAAPASGFMPADVPHPGGVNYPGPQPGTPPWVHSTYNNTYNPATKTFWMHYGYAVGAADYTGYTRQVYEEWIRQ